MKRSSSHSLVEVVNGTNGMKWGMTEKASNIPRNYPTLSKYVFFNAYARMCNVDKDITYLNVK